MSLPRPWCFAVTCWNANPYPQDPLHAERTPTYTQILLVVLSAMPSQPACCFHQEMLHIAACLLLQLLLLPLLHHLFPFPLLLPALYGSTTTCNLLRLPCRRVLKLGLVSRAAEYQAHLMYVAAKVASLPSVFPSASMMYQFFFRLAASPRVG